VFFAGGGSTFRLKDGSAKIFVLTFDEQMDLITSVVLPSESGS